MLRAAILHECQNYCGAIIPDARPLGTFENQDIPVTVRRGISKRSHEKIGDCEQSSDFWMCFFLLWFAKQALHVQTSESWTEVKTEYDGEGARGEVQWEKLPTINPFKSLKLSAFWTQWTAFLIGQHSINLSADVRFQRIQTWWRSTSSGNASYLICVRLENIHCHCLTHQEEVLQF